MHSHGAGNKNSSFGPAGAVGLHSSFVQRLRPRLVRNGLVITSEIAEMRNPERVLFASRASGECGTFLFDGRTSTPRRVSALSRERAARLCRRRPMVARRALRLRR
jgi:hypothetical protein